MTTKIFIGVLVFIITLCIDLVTDFNRWENNKTINHTRGAILRLCGLAPACYLMGWLSIPAAGFVYWLFFDGFFNLLRHFNFWFTGSEDKDDAKTDDFLQRLTLTQHILIKVGGCAASITVFLYFM